MEPQIEPVFPAWMLQKDVVDWVIVGGESRQMGGEPRQFNLDWARTWVRDCRRYAVPLFVKQMGSNVVTGPGASPVTFRDSHGGDWDEWDSRLRVRQCPETYRGRPEAAEPLPPAPRRPEPVGVGGGPSWIGGDRSIVLE